MAVNNLNSGVGILPTIVDAKGDLIAATANDAVNRLAVGTNGQVLVADSGETTGLKWNNPGTVGGLVHINTTDIGAGITSISVNNVFSASYDVYKAFIELDETSVAAGDLVLRLRVSGTDNTSSQYAYAGSYRNAANTSFAGLNSTGTTYFYAGVQSSQGMGLVIDFFNPFQSTFRTKINLQSFGQAFANWNGGSLTVDTSYDGFTLLTLSGTISTGKIRVFGVKQ